MRSRATISSPSFSTSSSRRGARWQPVATSSVTSIPGFPRRSRSSIGGTSHREGTGRVWSLRITVAVRFPDASASSRGEPIGSSSARATSAAGSEAGGGSGAS